MLPTLAACGTAADEMGPDFVGDNPNASGSYGETGTGAVSSSGGDGTDSAGEGGDDGGREITEADIVQLEGDRLYALSRFGGLAVVDVSNPAQLPVLGRYRANAQPFEMVVENGQAFVMYFDYGSYGWDDEAGGWSWHTASRLVALDASNPADIVVRGELELPGTIQDSRRVGDILYVVTYEDGYCWNCKDNPNTTITSLDVSNQAAIEIVDQITFETPFDDYWGWWGPRSVATTDQRLYVAGHVGSETEPVHSVIDVIDIADPGGALVRGTNVEVAGVIENRWQMDEHDGILRVVSQEGAWGSDVPPIVETFSVLSAHDVLPLGSLEMTLPRPESLQSVRFDGPRAFVITFEQTDPLFTLDLSDPATPQQLGELEIPGWVYHMETRGDRVLGLGYDPGNPEGSINVSLFDVTDLGQPALLSRVHFGGDWASFAEDQNRIHKAFTILDELGLLLVPFSGWSQTDPNDYCGGEYQSGVQLVDWAGDALALRGVAESNGQSRRALLHRERLIGVSDKAVESFDIADRDAPEKLAELTLASNVSRVGVGDGLVVRLSQDWYTSEIALEVTSTADPESPDPIGRLSLAEQAQTDGYECWDYSFWSADIFVHGGYAYLVRDTYGYDVASSSTKLDVIDLSDPTQPAFVQTLDLGFTRGYASYGSGGARERRTVKVGAALVMLQQESEWEGDELGQSTASFEVVDLSGGANPSHVASIARADALSHGGLQVFGNQVVSWQMRSANDDGSKVRFYLERLDVSQPAAPAVAQPINVPGTVVAYDHDADRAVTVDFQLEAAHLSQEECWNHPRVHGWDYDTNTCHLAQRELVLVRLDGGEAFVVDRADVEGQDGRLSAVAASPTRMFVHLRRGSWEWDESGAYTEVPSEEIVTFAGIDDDALESASTVELESSGWYVSLIDAVGERLLFGADYGLGEVDATDPGNPTSELHDSWGWGCYDAQIDGDTAYCALGELGLQAIAL